MIAGGSEPAEAGRVVVPVSDRVRLARLALAAATGVEGVEGGVLDPAGVYAVGDGAVRLDGVAAAAVAGRGYDITLRLRCTLVPLHETADAVRRAVAAAAAAAGLEAKLGSVSVIVAEVVEPRYERR